MIFDPVGGELFDQCTRSINWNGRILVVGFASGTIPKYPVNLALLKGCATVGVFWGEFRQREPDVYRENCKTLFDLFEQGKIKPLISQVFPLQSHADALNVFVHRQAVGKIVLSCRPSDRRRSRFNKLENSTKSVTQRPPVHVGGYQRAAILRSSPLSFRLFLKLVFIPRNCFKTA